jgi:magnesium-transporting ATPase (P-type)
MHSPFSLLVDNATYILIGQFYMNDLEMYDNDFKVKYIFDTPTILFLLAYGSFIFLSCFALITFCDTSVRKIRAFVVWIWLTHVVMRSILSVFMGLWHHNYNNFWYLLFLFSTYFYLYSVMLMPVKKIIHTAPMHDSRYKHILMHGGQVCSCVVDPQSVSRASHNPEARKKLNPT